MHNVHGGPPRIAAWSTWSGPEGSSHSYLLQVPGVRLATFIFPIDPVDMSYQVLARKWRPRNFSTLVGQEHVVRALSHALAEQRLHHAYLFTGTRGVGKTTILAEAARTAQV